MQFLKILFWCLLTFLAALFTYGNWTTVPIRLWGGLIAEINLPLLLFLLFLCGFLPMWLYHHTVRWRLRQRLASAQRAVNDLRLVPPPPPVMANEPIPAPAPAPSAAPDVPPEPA
ncbi:lipopolysaccharide assembly protein LapA domain-containing protein [Sphingomonas aracearum]|uniref:DUF1049 domain-containing protein n=1 Tax=Sphingomonas aracearum TaxID=2283317 RepID=A0A369VRS9_9SPHN|nr:lipopolysaccharide assembly protein LapA domain-containing protein [Sphingomonas aracearum]RDE05088.1 DUF1049 domain-containing protein [Sphingomonas aracearum]